MAFDNFYPVDRMSRSSSKHKQTSSRHYDIVNGSSALFGKHGHRCNQDNDVHREHRQHYHKSHERDRHRHIGRRSPEEGHSTCRQRSRRSSGDVSPEFVAVKRLRRGSTERRRFPYSRSPRLKHGPANNGPIQVKEHSPFSRTSTSPHSRVVAEVNSRVKSGTDSIGSFSPPLMASPPSPTSSFGNSLFDGQALQSRTLAASPSDVYVPELLHLPACQPATNHAATVPAVALNSHDAPQSSQKVEEEEDMVPMDLASSLSAHQSPAIDKEPTQRPSTPPLPPQQGEQPAMDTKGHRSFSDTSSMSGPSAGIELSKAAKALNQRMQAQRNKLMPVKRITLPPLHLHLSEDGTSPIPPGWQRAPNTASDGSDGGYAYYYYHTKTRQTRWDPPVYPWDADPEDNLIPDRPDDDPEAPYNWNCAHRFAVTHEEIEAMYAQYRSRILERQCMELIHEMGARPDTPQGAQEQNFAIELFTLIHNELRQFRDARVNLGRITSDEDLYYLTNKLAQEVIPKEIRSLHRAQQANASSLFAAVLPEVTPAIRERATSYVRRYMEAKGSCYRRFNPHHHNHHHAH